MSGLHTLAAAVWDFDRNGSIDLRDLTFAAALVVAVGAAATRIVRWARGVRTATRHAIVGAVKAELTLSEQRVRAEVSALREEVTTRMDAFDSQLAGHLGTEELGAEQLRDELAAIRRLAEQAAQGRTEG